MSWISGIVDKAENILDKLDQNAASALQNPRNSSRTLGTNSLTSVENENSAPNSTYEMEDDGFKLNCHKESLSAESNQVAVNIDELIRNNHMKSGLVTDIVKSNNSKDDEICKQDLNAFKIALCEVICERDDLKQQVKYLIQERDNKSSEEGLIKMEILMQTLIIEKERIHTELLATESLCRGYKETITELESNLADSKRKNAELTEKFQMQIKETEQISKDLEEYRNKAHRALQIKDNLISGLKSDLYSNLRSETYQSFNKVTEIKSEFETLRQEVETLKEDNASLLQQLDGVRRDWKDSCTEHNSILSSMISKEDALTREICFEKKRFIQLESEHRVLSQEITTLRQQLRNQSNMKHDTVFGKEIKSVCEDHEGYNLRIKLLTDALVEKQNCVEVITADRNALRIQLERVQEQLKGISLERNSLSRGQQRMFSNTTDDVKLQFPLLMKENPFDNRVARRVKRVYSSLDSAGIRLGAFLRHYPLMRICVLIYIGLLHVWVIFVLLSSTPS